MPSEASKRLRLARERAGYETAAEFCRVNDLQESTYRSHENGTRGFSRDKAKLYARRLGVTEAWLLDGKEGDDITADYLAIPAVKMTAEIMFKAVLDGRYRQVEPGVLADMLAELARHFHPGDFPDREAARAAANASLRFALEHQKQ